MDPFRNTSTYKFLEKINIFIEFFVLRYTDMISFGFTDFVNHSVPPAP